MNACVLYVTLYNIIVLKTISSVVSNSQQSLLAMKDSASYTAPLFKHNYV